MTPLLPHMMPGPFKYHLFLSHSHTDSALAREIERFLESFHNTPATSDLKNQLTPLQICRDGSDFCLPPPDEGSSEEESIRDVTTVVYSYLAQSRELLVLCSGQSAKSDMVEKEIAWFIEHRGRQFVRYAYTEGKWPYDNPESYVPNPLIEYVKQNNPEVYDLRGYDPRRSSKWDKVPAFHDELVKLASDLLGQPRGDLYPIWLEAELERKLKESLAMASTARFETLGGDPARALLIAYRAHELRPSEATETALREAYKVAVLHHHNRREVGRITGSGPAYLAGRWKQGEIFTKASPDGKFRLLVTERGKDGAHPPGDIYLVSNETLRAIKLEPLERKGGRVEYVAFDSTSKHVFVSRYFNLAVYGTDGNLLGEYYFGRHTKHPVHLVNGYFADQYILGAETTGGLWLVDIKAGSEGTLTIFPESHGDAAISSDISASRQCALLVFESGRAVMLTLDNQRKPRLRELASRGALFAGFVSGHNDTFIISRDDGSIAIYYFDEHSVRVTRHMKPLPSPVDWVTLDETGTRMVAVAANDKLYILDRLNDELLATLDYEETIDWGNMRVVPVPRRESHEGPIEDLGQPVSFKPEKYYISNVQSIDDETWVFAEEWTNNETWPKIKVHRLDGSSLVELPGVQAKLMEKHGDCLWMRVSSKYGGAAFRRLEDGLRRVPRGDLEVNCIHQKEGSVWLGTRMGAYLMDVNGSRLMTPENLIVNGFMELAGRLWILADVGAFVFENGRLIRITEPFLDIREIKQAGGRVWILTQTRVMFDSDGPAHCVQGYFSTPIPSDEAKISDVFDADGAVWLAESDRLHRVQGDHIRTISGISPNVDAIVQTGRMLWLTTYSRGLLPLKGQSYCMNADTLDVKPLGFSGTLMQEAGRAWMRYTDGEGQDVLAELFEEGLHPRDFGGAYVNAIVDRNGEPWFLTTVGLYRAKGESVSPVDAPQLCYKSMMEANGERWFLATDHAVRLEKKDATCFPTDGFSPWRVLFVAGHIWILTLGSCGEAGPAYRIDHCQATPFKPENGGVKNVVEIESKTWLLTEIQGRAGKLMGPY